MSSNLKVQSQYTIIICVIYTDIFRLNKEVDAPKPKLWGSCRLSITICVFLACVQTALLRDNLGIGLVCMSKPDGNSTCDRNDAIVPTLPGLTNKKVRIFLAFYNISTSSHGLKFCLLGSPSQSVHVLITNII